jgi:hypothetical protein
MVALVDLTLCAHEIDYHIVCTKLYVHVFGCVRTTPYQDGSEN